MGNVLSYLFPKPAPASIEQIVEVSEDVAKTMEATQDLNETIAADIGLIDDSNPEDLVVCSINEGNIEAQEAATEALKVSGIVIENTMAEVETIGSIQEIDVKVVDATIIEPTGVAPLSNIETSPEPVKSPNPEPELEVIATLEIIKTHNVEENMSGGVDGLRDVLQAATPEPPKSPTPEPTSIPESIKVSTSDPAKSPTDDEEEMSGGVDGLMDVLQASTPEPQKAPTPEPNPTPELKDYTLERVKSSTPSPEPKPIPESIKVSIPEPVKTPTPEPEVDVIGTIEEHNAQKDKEDMSVGVEGLMDILQAASSETPKSPTSEPTLTPGPVKSPTLEPLTPEPTPIPESIKFCTPDPIKSPTPEPPKTQTPEPVKTPTPEPEVEVIGTIEENKAQDKEEEMSGGVDGLRDVLQAATSDPPKSPTPEAAASTPKPLKAPSHEPINISTSENKNVPSSESIIATTINDEEEISGGAAGLRDALQVSKDLNEE